MEPELEAIWNEELLQTTVGGKSHSEAWWAKDTHWSRARVRLEAFGNNWQVDPPNGESGGIAVVKDASTLGLNVNNVIGANYHDYIIDGTGDSAVLLQGTTHDCNFERFHLSRIYDKPAVDWFAHGIYLKAYGNTFDSFWISGKGSTAPKLGQGFSVRMHNNTITRSYIEDMTLCFAYFEQSGTYGYCKVVDAEWHSTHPDTIIWGDGNLLGIRQRFLFENVAAYGPGPSFLRFAAYVNTPGYVGEVVEVKGCTLNDKPVKGEQVLGVPADKLEISL